MKQLINILWTGGLDSTFRLVELSREDVEIQPYYILDPSRNSVPQERKAMRKIYSALHSKTSTKANLKEIIFIDLKTITKDDNIKSAWTSLNLSHKLGSQYDFLARFAIQNNLILEVGLENSERSKATNVLKSYGALKMQSYLRTKNMDSLTWDKVYAIDTDSATTTCRLIFENLRFPAHLFNIEKIEEAQKLRDWGCEDILKLTWFCHSPIFGLPCGQCNPCRDALNEGMEWRVPTLGKVLGFIRAIPKNTVKKILRR